MVSIDFEINGYKDALVLSDDHGLTDSEIESMKQQRYNKWRDFVENPPVLVDEE